MKEKIKNLNIIKYAWILIFILLGCMFCLAIICKGSYIKEIDEDEVRYRVFDEEYKNIYDDVEIGDVVSGFDEQDNIFLVTAEKSENFFGETKTTVHIEKVIKGDTALVDENAVIYEMCRVKYSSGYSSANKIFSFYSPNSWNNIMRVGERYLVSVNNFNYSEEYEKTLTLKEFSALDYAIGVYSVPVDNEITYIDPNLIVIDSSKIEVSGDMIITKAEDSGLYKYVKDYDWFCYTEEQAELLEEIRQTIIEKYLGE